MVSIEDVARRAGVSVATVSRALRGLPNVATTTRLKVEAAARDLDYVSDPSASRLAAGRTHVLGIVVPNLHTWYAAKLMAAVHGVWSEAGYELLAMVVDDHSDLARFVRELPFRKRVDGLLLVDVPFTDADCGRLLQTGVPVVAAGSGNERVPSVGIDERAAARRLVEHVVGLGHRDVALLAGELERPFQWPGARERQAGMEEALAAAGIEVPAHRQVVTDWSLPDAAAGMAVLLEADPTPPTAVVCVSDEIAVAAMGVLRRRGLVVPRDVTVVGFDDHDLSEHIDLTTIHQPVATVGRRAAELLVRQLASTGPDGSTRDVLPTRLQVRGSSAPPRRSDASARSTPRVRTAPTRRAVDAGHHQSSPTQPGSPRA